MRVCYVESRDTSMFRYIPEHLSCSVELGSDKSERWCPLSKCEPRQACGKASLTLVLTAVFSLELVPSRPVLMLSSVSDKPVS